jgi:hypothetical protein
MTAISSYGTRTRGTSLLLDLSSCRCSHLAGNFQIPHPISEDNISKARPLVAIAQGFNIVSIDKIAKSLMSWFEIWFYEEKDQKKKRTRLYVTLDFYSSL